MPPAGEIHAIASGGPSGSEFPLAKAVVHHTERSGVATTPNGAFVRETPCGSRGACLGLSRGCLCLRGARSRGRPITSKQRGGERGSAVGACRRVHLRPSGQPRLKTHPVDRVRSRSAALAVPKDALRSSTSSARTAGNTAPGRQWVSGTYTEPARPRIHGWDIRPLSVCRTGRRPLHVRAVDSRASGDERAGQTPADEVVDEPVAAGCRCSNGGTSAGADAPMSVITSSGYGLGVDGTGDGCWSWSDDRSHGRQSPSLRVGPSVLFRVGLDRANP
jgi:hypothetical protein